jgi:alpha-tubulin suppressor-like RCC1 family protein
MVALAVLWLTPTFASAASVNAIWNSATDVPVTGNGYTATGNTISFTINFAPATGTDLMVVKNTGLDFIAGTFNNLSNGQMVALSYGGKTYPFVANYYGGNGNDLVLLWAASRPLAWGSDSDGQLGDGTALTNRWLPVPVTTTGVLAGKTIVAFAAGYVHSVALCSDGTLAAWGNNYYYGQLGNNSSTNSPVPVAVNTQAGVSALYGKRVVAISAGFGYTLALCSDGTVATWGENGEGELGDGTTTNRPVPVLVNTTAGVSALAGKKVVAIAAGGYHNLALCSDGTLAAWGWNPAGQVGDGTTTDRHVPVLVNTAPGLSALAGKTVVAVAGGDDTSLALCSDGTVAAWGDGGDGELGNNSFNNTNVPVAVDTSAGSALQGKTVVAIAAGSWHNLALCSDGTLAAWGIDFDGELGDNTTTGDDMPRPVAVNTAAGVSALYGKTVTSISANYLSSFALCSDGTLTGWGYNNEGEVGDNTTTQRNVPVVVNASALAASQPFTRLLTAAEAWHTLTLAAAPPAAPIILAGARKLSDGSFQFGFTNQPGALFSALATANPALPLSDWSSLGAPAEISPGQFLFIDPQATNTPERFYRIRSP